MGSRCLFWALAIAAIFAASAALTIGGLSWVRADVVSRSAAMDTDGGRGRGQRDNYACIWGRDLDPTKLEDATRTAADAVGLRMTGLQVETAPGARPGQSRVLSLDVEAVGGFDTAMGFLRLAIFEKPALEVEHLRIAAAGPGLVELKLSARAECGF